MANEHVVEATDANFEEVVLNSDIPVLVDYWATWCGPCKAIAPAVDKLAEEFAGRVKIVKVDAQSNMKTARSQRVANLPTFVVYKSGQEFQRKMGTAGGLNGLRQLAERAL